MLDLLNSLFRSISPLWEMSVTAAYAAAVVILLRLLLKRRAPRQVLCLLWLVVFARLLIPVSLESPLSIVPDALPGQGHITEQAPAGPGAGDPVTPTVPQGPVQDQIQNQPGNGTVTPVTGGQNPALSVPEGVNPAAPATKAPAAFPWQAVIAGVWLTGAAAMGGYALVSWLRMRRRLFDAIRAEDGVWEHPAVDSPFILGVLRPRIYLPAGLAGQPRQFILCHERAHLRRLDHLVKPVCWAALALHWFNPLVWAAFLLMSRDIEAACDEAVVRRLGSGVKADYSDTLLTLATGRRFPAPCPLAFDEGDAGSRIRNVLNYRRPALWAIVISVTAAALAAVCLLTDPVAAKGSKGAPDDDPDPGVSSSQDAEGLSSLLDPWMKEFLDGERTFSGGYDDRAYSINDLKLFFFGDEQACINLTIYSLAILDLDRDGVNEMILTPIGDNNYLTSDLGYLILRRAGDEVYGYDPPYRGFNGLKADGTFYWSNSAFEGGTASMSFDGHQYGLNYITWCAPTGNMQDELYFVNGREATRAEFEAAVSAQDAKPEPTWYVYRNGVLGIDTEFPLDREIDLDRDGVPESVRVADDDGVGLRLELWEGDELLWTGKASYYGSGTSYLLYSTDGESYLMEFALGGHQGSGHGAYRIFTLENGVETTVRENGVQYDYCDVSHSADVRNNFDPEAVAAFVDEVEDLLERCTLLVDTGGNYWEDSSGRLRVNLRATLETYCTRFTWDDSRTTLENLREFRALYLANEAADPYAIYTAAPLDAPIVDIYNIPEDADQWYKVAELPDDMIWMFSRDHGAEILLRWDGNFFMSFDHTAHTSLGVLPRLKKLGDSIHYGPLAVISNVDEGTGMFIEELVVYDLDAIPAATGYTHDWSPLRNDFNENVSYQYDKNTRTLTCTYQGQTVKAVIDVNDEARLRIERDYPELEQKDLRLCVTGEFVYYRFDEAGDGGVRIELPVGLYVGDEVVPLIFPGRVSWTLRFNGSGFDTVPGSCLLTA